MSNIDKLKEQIEAIRKTQPLQPQAGQPLYSSPNYRTTPQLSTVDLSEYQKFTGYQRLSGVNDIERLNEVRAQNQSAFGQAVNSVGKFGLYAGVTFADGIVGTAAGLLNATDTALKGGSFSDGWAAFWNNPVSNVGQDILNWAEKAMPNYRTAAELDAPFWKNLGTVNFWGDTVFKNLGFAAGALASASVTMGASLELSGAKAIARNSLGRAARKLGMSEEALQAGLRSGKVDVKTLTGALADDVRTLNNINASSQLFGSLIAASTEARFEAIQTARDYYDELVAQGVDERTASERSLMVGNRTFGLNLGILSLSNFAQFRTMFNPGYNASVKANGLLSRQNGKYVASTTSNKSKLLRSLGNPLVEGLEETGQLFASEFSKSYVDRVTDPETTSFINATLGASIDGMAKVFSEEGAESFFVGALIGSMGMPNFGRAIREKSIAPLFTKWSGGIREQYRALKEQEAKASKDAEELNKVLSNEHFQETYINTAASLSASRKKLEALKSGDKLAYELAGTQELHANVQQFINAGKIDDLYSLYDEQENKSGKQLREEWMVGEEDTFKNLRDEEIVVHNKERVKQMRDLTKKIQQFTENVEVKTKGILSPVIQKELVEYLTIAEVGQERVKGIQRELVTGLTNRRKEAFNKRAKDFAESGDTSKITNIEEIPNIDFTNASTKDIDTIIEALSSNKQIKDPKTDTQKLYNSITNRENKELIAELISYKKLASEAVDAYEKIMENPEKYQGKVIDRIVRQADEHAANVNSTDPKQAFNPKTVQDIYDNLKAKGYDVSNNQLRDSIQIEVEKDGQKLKPTISPAMDLASLVDVDSIRIPTKEQNDKRILEEKNRTESEKIRTAQKADKEGKESIPTDNEVTLNTTGRQETISSIDSLSEELLKKQNSLALYAEKLKEQKGASPELDKLLNQILNNVQSDSNRINNYRNRLKDLKAKIENTLQPVEIKQFTQAANDLFKEIKKDEVYSGLGTKYNDAEKSIQDVKNKLFSKLNDQAITDEQENFTPQSTEVQVVEAEKIDYVKNEVSSNTYLHVEYEFVDGEIRDKEVVQTFNEGNYVVPQFTANPLQRNFGDWMSTVDSIGQYRLLVGTYDSHSPEIKNAINRFNPDSEGKDSIWIVVTDKSGTPIKYRGNVLLSTVFDSLSNRSGGDRFELIPIKDFVSKVTGREFIVKTSIKNGEKVLIYGETGKDLKVFSKSEHGENFEQMFNDNAYQYFNELYQDWKSNKFNELNGNTVLLNIQDISNGSPVYLKHLTGQYVNNTVSDVFNSAENFDVQIVTDSLNTEKELNLPKGGIVVTDNKGRSFMANPRLLNNREIDVVYTLLRDHGTDLTSKLDGINIFPPPTDKGSNVKQPSVITQFINFGSVKAIDKDGNRKIDRTKRQVFVSQSNNQLVFIDGKGYELNVPLNEVDKFEKAIKRFLSEQHINIDMSMLSQNNNHIEYSVKDGKVVSKDLYKPYKEHLLTDVLQTSIIPERFGLAQFAQRYFSFDWNQPIINVSDPFELKETMDVGDIFGDDQGVADKELDNIFEGSKNKKAKLKQKIDSLPNDMVYLTHITREDTAKNIFDTQFSFNLGTGLTGTFGVNVSKDTLYNVMSNLIDGNSPHNNLFGMFIVAIPSKLFTKPGNLTSEDIENYLLENHPEMASGNIPKEFNFGYFANGVLTTKNINTTPKKSNLSRILGNRATKPAPPKILRRINPSQTFNELLKSGQIQKNCN